MSLQRDYDSLECSTLLATDIDASVVATFREVVSEASGFGQVVQDSGVANKAD